MWLQFITGKYKKSSIFGMLSFSFCIRSQHIFCSSWSRGISEKSRKEIYIACSKFVFKNLFPSSRSLTLKERKDIWPIRAWYQSGIMERRHQRHVYRLRRLFHPPQTTAGLASLADIFPICFVFCLFSPHCGTWSQANQGANHQQ